MNTQTAILVITCILNMIGAISIWLTKVWWTNEFSEAKKAQIEAIAAQLQQISAAKEEIIRTKDAQIESLKAEIQRTKDDVQNLRELTPMKIQEYFVSVKTQLEAYIDDLKGQLKLAHEEIERTKQDIETATIEREFLATSGIMVRDLIEKLKENEYRLEEKARFLEGQLAIKVKDNEDDILELDDIQIPTSNGLMLVNHTDITTNAITNSLDERVLLLLKNIETMNNYGQPKAFVKHKEF